MVHEKPLSLCFLSLAIIFVALILRICWLDAGLEGATSVADEEQVVVRALRFGWGDLNPHWFLYPTFSLYLVACLFVGYFAFGHLVGLFNSTHDFGLSFFAHPEIFYLIARSLSALLGTATVILMFHISKRLTRSNGIAALSAYFLAVSFFHVQVSQSAKPDAVMIFFMMCSYFLTVKFWDQRQLRHAILAGAMAGLSISTKYPAGLILLPLFAAILGCSSWAWSRRVLVSGLCGVIAVAVFVIGTPYSLLDFSTFIKWMEWVGGHADLVWRGQEYHNHGVYGIYLFQLWPKSSGLILCVLSLAGVIYFSFKGRMSAVLAGVYPLAYLLFMGRSTHVMDNFFTPLVPFLALYAAIAADAIFSFVRRWKRAVMVSLVAAASIQPLTSILRWQYNRTVPGTMVVASRWITKHVPDGSRILAVNAAPPVNLSRNCLQEIRNGSLTDGTVPDATGSRYTGKGLYYDYLLNNVRSPAYYVRTIPSGCRKIEDTKAQLKLDAYRSFRIIVLTSLSDSGCDTRERLSPVMLPGPMVRYHEEMVDAYHSFVSEITNNCERLLLVDRTNTSPEMDDPFIFRLLYRLWGRPGQSVEVFRMPEGSAGGDRKQSSAPE